MWWIHNVLGHGSQILNVKLTIYYTAITVPNYILSGKDLGYANASPTNSMVHNFVVHRFVHKKTPGETLGCLS